MVSGIMILFINMKFVISYCDVFLLIFNLCIMCGKVVLSNVWFKMVMKVLINIIDIIKFCLVLDNL